MDTRCGAGVLLVMSGSTGPRRTREQVMAVQYRSAAVVADAIRAESSLAVKWAEAYAQAHADMQQAGANLRDLGQAITKAGVKCGKDLAGDFVLAHGLTVHGATFIAALAKHLGEGKVMRAHSLITKARNARGVGYVRGVIATLEGLEDEALAKAIAKAIRELDAAKRQTPPNDGDVEDGGEVEVEVEDDEDQGGEVATTPPSAKASSIIAVLESLTADWRDGVAGADTALTAVLRACAAVAREHAAKQAA